LSSDRLGLGLRAIKDLVGFSVRLGNGLLCLSLCACRALFRFPPRCEGDLLRRFPGPLQEVPRLFSDLFECVPDGGLG
jgi:hypothetical protein